MDRLKRLDKRVYVILLIVIILLVLLVSLIIKKTYSMSDTTSLADVNINENITFSDVKISTTDSVFKYSGYLISNKDISDVNYINIIPEDEAGNTLATLVDYIGVDIIAGVKKEISASTNKVVLTSMHDIRYEIVKNDGSVIKVSETSLASTTTTTTTNTTTETVCDGKVYTFDYTGGEQTFSPDCDGYYQFEVWGAQGGSSGGIGGYGAYSTGVTHLNKDDILYIAVGGVGSAYGDRGYNESYWAWGYGGYNGGGSGYAACGQGGGGGATHIATTSGVLSSLSDATDSILIVASGGGGAYHWYRANGNGNHGGGYTTSVAYNTYAVGSFGQGGNGRGDACGGGAGGGGYLGGNGGGNVGFGGGGSSYIASSNLISYKEHTKAMYCYNCAESSDESTKTISTTNVSETPISAYAKSGNGYARITFIGNSLG